MICHPAELGNSLGDLEKSSHLCGFSGRSLPPFAIELGGDAKEPWELFPGILRVLIWWHRSLNGLKHLDESRNSLIFGLLKIDLFRILLFKSRVGMENGKEIL